jgi:hypothetical protein
LIVKAVGTLHNVGIKVSIVSHVTDQHLPDLQKSGP